MTRPQRKSSRPPMRAWLLGLLIGVIAGAASIYVIARPPADAPLQGTIAPNP